MHFLLHRFVLHDSLYFCHLLVLQASYNNPHIACSVYFDRFKQQKMTILYCFSCCLFLSELTFELWISNTDVGCSLLLKIELYHEIAAIKSHDNFITTVFRFQAEKIHIICYDSQVNILSESLSFAKGCNIFCQ